MSSGMVTEDALAFRTVPDLVCLRAFQLSEWHGRKIAEIAAQVNTPKIGRSIRMFRKLIAARGIDSHYPKV